MNDWSMEHTESMDKKSSTTPKCRKCGGDGYKQLTHTSPKILCDRCGGNGCR